VFQLESSGMRNFLMQMRPGNFEDIIAAISLYRPGPMESIPRYIAGKQDPSKVQYTAPQLKPILDVTYGCMVYQEQVMQIVRDLAGYSMSRSDLVRRAMAKKKHDVMNHEKEIFINGQVENGEVVVPGCVRNGVTAEAAERIFDEMTAFASYAFNKSHAAAYGVVAVQTGYLKLHYPVEFMAALMNSMMGNTPKIAYYIQNCRKRGIPVLPPDVNRSEEKFIVDVTDGKKGIRFGLAAIKSLGHAPVKAMVEERQSGGAFADIFDLINRMAGSLLNKKGVESLIRSGAMDSLPGGRAQKLHVFERAMDGAAKRAKDMVAGQISLFGMSDSVVDAPPPPMPELEEFSLTDRLQMEKETTGVYITGHPLDDYADELSLLEVNSQMLADLAETSPDVLMSYDQRPVSMGGLITEKRMKATRSGNMMCFVQLEDLYGVTEVLVFPKVYERYGAMLAEETAVLMTGKLSVREDEAPKLLMDRVAPLKGASPVVQQQPERPERAAPRYPVSRPKGEMKLYLKLRSEQREKVLSILEETPGRICVVLYMEDEKKAYQAPREYWVDEGYDFGALANLLGADSVVLK